MARVLLLHGADVNAVDKDGDSLFWLATYCDYQYTMRLLMRHGANVNSRNSRGMTALLWVTMREEPIRMQILIEAGADPNIQDSDGDTCLAYAKYVGGALGGRMVKLLTAAGAKR
jgi:ankyrin repeat protein